MQPRIAGYDFARSLALFGLVAANFISGVKIAEYGLYYVSHALLHSLMRSGAVATFLVLGGVGISLLTQQVRATNDAHRIVDNRKRLIRRAASLLAVGIGCSLIWNTNFLCFYSVCIIIGVLLLTVSNRWLWLLTFVFVAVFVVFISLIYGYFDYYDVIRNWKTFQDSDAWTIKGVVFRLYFNGFNSMFSWTVFLLIGMWLGRQEVHYPRVRRDVLFGGIGVALVMGGVLWMLSFELPRSFHPASISEWLGMENATILAISLSLFAMCGIASAITGGSLMLTEKYPDAKWIKPFIATGQLALTLYVVHLVIGRGLLEVLGVVGSKALPFAIGSAAIFCICAVIFSHVWRKRFERGPLEWGMRRITG